MSEPDSFSGRVGLRSIAIVHDDAPIGFRHAVVGAMKTEIISSETIIGVVQRGTTLPRPSGHDSNMALMAMIEKCEWWRVYDVAEAGHAAIHAEPYFGPRKAKAYERTINEACRANSLGWRMEAGIFAVVASTAQHDSAARAIEDLDAAELKTSASELREAHRDLSRLPRPDISGGMQHAGAAIECLARHICWRVGQRPIAEAFGDTALGRRAEQCCESKSAFALAERRENKSWVRNPLASYIVGSSRRMAWRPN